MSAIITFGNVFHYKEKDYVFLAKIEDIIYAAEILNDELSFECKKIRDSVAKNSTKSYKFSQNIMFCFVELRTDEFKERVAFYGKPQMDEAPDSFQNVIGVVNNDDLANLHKELLEDSMVIPIELKEQLQEIKIK